MTTNYVTYNKDRSSINGFGAPFCDTVFSATLVAGADTTIAVPLKAGLGAPAATTFNKFLAVFCYNSTSPIYVANNATATVPAGGAFAATTSEMIPYGISSKVVKSTDTLHFISAGTPSITVAFYAIQE